MSIDLIWLGEADPPRWSAGKVYLVRESTPADIDGLVRRGASDSEAEAWLFWDGSLGAPDQTKVADILRKPGDLWHAGLLLGTAGLPRMIDFVRPSWMLNRDPNPDTEATSWRMSLRAALIPTDVLRRLGGPSPEFASLSGASLDLGHRYIASGVLMRHVPQLLNGRLLRTEVRSKVGISGRTKGRSSVGCSTRNSLPLEDEVRFLRRQSGVQWSLWATLRAAATGYASPVKLLDAWGGKASPISEASEYCGNGLTTAESERCEVSVLIPTLDRYAYLRTLLDQLRQQTVPPLEIIVVDQTHPKARDVAISDDFDDLPLSIIYRDTAGQCSSRNAGLVRACGEYVLFLDDDDEVEPDLIQKHLENLRRSRADVSCGVAEEADAGPLPAAFKKYRASDVFPTNNTMVRRDVLRPSGLFDLAYEQGQRADKDLGMRLYLNGALIVLNPAIRVFHHHAPQGGLRNHGARVVTYASSRSKMLHRHLPSVSELYFAHRYLTRTQIREWMWMRTFGTLSARGGRLRRIGKVAAGLLQMPHTVFEIGRRSRAAAAMMETYPDIPQLEEKSREAPISAPG